jgi:hypothetical protein
MILPRQRLIVPDGTGALTPQAMTFFWPSGSDVRLPFEVVHSSGTAYNLSGNVSGVLAFREKEGDDIALQLQWTVTNAALGYVKFDIVRGDEASLTKDRYAIGIQFRDDDTGFEDTITGFGSRVSIGPRIADFDTPVTVQPTQLPLAQGPALGALVARTITTTAVLPTGAATVNNLVLVTGDVVVLHGASNGTNSGAWTVDTTGAWSRTTTWDADQAASGRIVYVVDGTTNDYANTVWVCTDDPDVSTIGTDTLHFEWNSPFRELVFDTIADRDAYPGPFFEGMHCYVLDNGSGVPEFFDWSDQVTSWQPLAFAIGIRRTANEAIPQYTLVKESTTAGRVELFKTTDDASLYTGVALEAAASAGSIIRVMHATGIASSLKSDGTTVIAAGDPIEPSTTVNGRVRKAATVAVVGVAQSAAAATLDALVTVI